ncbi:uncharacterized protein RJT20DRAFT_123525 [Scheffersomyces xylosifermentans]|uniref:uncharacterized protein n=1 Tax=Scheffersomyces xylosifermentans TaxID=1304137 RepID=UPI00315DCCD1
MNIQRLRNLIASKSRNVSRRIQRALQELSENLGNEAQPQTVPIPVRHGGSGRRLAPQSRFGPLQFAGLATGRRFYSGFSGFTGFSSFSSANITWGSHQFNGAKGSNFFSRTKLFSKFYNTNAHKSKILPYLNHGSLFHKFSSAYQSSFRLKVYQQSVKLTYRTLFCQLRERFSDFHDQANLTKKFNKTIRFNPSIRLNLSLTPDYHQLTLKLARTDSSATQKEREEADQVVQGCYIDFPINFSLNIPDETILSQEILSEMIDDIKRFEQRLLDLKNDLNNLFELGELPIKYISGKKVLRVYFPNCDVEKLESLCREKNITGGVIYEDVDAIESESEPSVASAVSMASSLDNQVTENDILSSYYNTNSSISSMDSDDEDIMSESFGQPISNEEIVRIEEHIPMLVEQQPQFAFQQMQPDSFNDYDEFYWVSST